MWKAGPAEILRSSQKDDAFIKQLQQDVQEIVQRLKGDQWWLWWHEQLDGAATYTYLLLTTISGLQTLGEEYAGIVQVTGPGRLPGLLRRWLMVSLHVVGPALLTRLAGQWDHNSARPRLGVLLQLLHQLHTTLFYLGGAYYHPEKRLTAVRYMLVRRWMGDSLSRRTFLLLGVVSLARLCVSGALQMHGIAAPAPDPAADPADADQEAAPASRRLRCPLCLCRRTVSSATPCGHLFCWRCVVDWLQTQPTCPVCREDTPPHSVVPLRGYDSEPEIGVRQPATGDRRPVIGDR